MNITHTHKIELPREAVDYLERIACSLACIEHSLDGRIEDEFVKVLRPRVRRLEALGREPKKTQKEK